MREKENDLFDKKKEEGRLQQFDVDMQLTYNHRQKKRETERSKGSSIIIID